VTRLQIRTKEENVKSNVHVESVASFSEELSELQELIRKKAYEKFESRGGGPGLELDDWLEAESEILLPQAVELRESERELLIRFAIPDINAKAISLQASSENLLLQVRDIDKLRFRLVHLPRAIDPDQTRAEYRNGSLRIAAIPGEDADSLRHAQSA